MTEPLSMLNLDEAAGEARVSVRTLQRHFTDPRHPLRRFRIGRRTLISRADLRDWVQRHAAAPTFAGLTVSAPVHELLKRLNGTPSAPGGSAC